MNQTSNLALDLIDKHLSAGMKDRIAIIDGSQQHSYADLYTSVLQAQSYIGVRHLAEGSKSILLFPDSFLSIGFYLGLIRAGIIPFYLNPEMLPAQLKEIVDSVNFSSIFYSNAINSELKNFLSELTISSYEVSLNDLESQQILPEFQQPALGHSEREAFGLFTSGSTGAPKGIVHRHKDVVVMNHDYMTTVVKLTCDDVILSTSKAYFAYGLNSILSALYVGATAVLAQTKLDLPKLWQLLSSSGVTVFFSVPTIYSFLLNEKDLPEQLSIRLAVSAGEALPEKIQERWMALYSAPIIDGIGTTEILSTFISNRVDDFKIGSTGKLVQGFQAQIITEDGSEAATGTIGILRMHGETYPHTYCSKSENSLNNFDKGWFITNDLFSVDADGYYYYHGRANELVKTGGRWISLYKIEQLILSLKNIKECLVVNVVQVSGLSRPVAYIVLHQAEEEIETTIKQLCKTRLSPWEYPHFVQVCSALPKTHTGKKRRVQLTEEHA